MIQSLRNLLQSPVTSLVARLFLGVIFLMYGLEKIQDPVTFLKLIREYQVTDSAWGLTAMAAWLPWVELVCGICLILGLGLRGAAGLSGVLLIGFTALVAWRAWGIYQGGGQAFCSIRFDCGCGGGEVLICGKLMKNLEMLLLSGFLVFWGSARWTLKNELFSWIRRA